MAKYCCSLAKLMNADLFRALSDQNRLEIIGRLADCGNMTNTVSVIASDFKTDISVVSRHLSILRNAGVLTSNRQGKEVYYTLEAETLAKILRQVADELVACSKKSPKKAKKK